MAWEESLKSIGGVKTGRIPLCVRPALSIRAGSGDLTSASGTFYFEPEGTAQYQGVPRGSFSAPIYFSQAWCAEHSEVGSAWPTAAKWTDLCMFEMKYANDPDTKYALVIMLGIWDLQLTDGQLQFGLKGEIRNIDDDLVVKTFPGAGGNAPASMQQANWFGPPDGIIIVPQIVEYEGVEYITFSAGSNTYRYDRNNFVIGSGVSFNLDDIHVWAPIDYEPVDWEPDDPDDDDEGEDNEDEDGGTHWRHWDPVPDPDIPPVGVSGGGFVTPYKLTAAEMQQFGEDIFTDNIWQAISNYFSKPMDAVAGCMIIPFNPNASSVWYPKFGLTTWPHGYHKLDSDFFTVDCGSTKIDGYYGGFLDYMAKISLWLPYIGYVNLNPDEVTDEYISIKYKVDCITGACTAFVMLGYGSPNNLRTIGQYTGNCGVQVPISGESFNNAIAAGLNLMTTIAGGAAMGAITGGAGAAAMAGVAGMIGGAANMIEGMKPNITRNGAPGSTSGYLGIQYPYIIKQLPRQARASGYREYKGRCANIGGTLSAFPGSYAEVSTIKLQGCTGTIAEIEEINRLLKEGVFV